VKVWKDEGDDMTVLKKKNCVVPKTEAPVLDSAVRIRGFGPEDVLSVRPEGADEDVDVSIYERQKLTVNSFF